jgi:hypothetical protein
VAFEGLVPVADVSVGAWLEPAMCGFGGRVCSVVPTAGFDAVARVLHPAEDRDGPVSWAEVCRRLGRTPHALMQWHSVAGVRQHHVVEGRWPRRRRWTTSTSEWEGLEPEVGNLPAPVLATLLDVLGRATGGGECYHALWEGHGWLDGTGVSFLVFEGSPPALPPPPALPEEVLAGPRLVLPAREHLLFRGPLGAARSIGDHASGRFSPQSPNLLWPEDRSWCVATEIDFDSTLVAGPQALVDAVLAEPGLEAWPVGPDDDLTHEGDRVNPRP